MKTKQIIKFSLILSLFSIFIFSFTYFGATAFGSRTATNQLFPENTMIGTIDISNKSAQEAQLSLEEKVNQWTTSADLRVSYKGETYNVATENFVFLIDESVNSAVDGERNELLIHLKDDAFSTLPVSLIAKLNQKNLEKELLKISRNFEQKSEISLVPYLPEEKPEVISTATFKLDGENHEIEKFVEIVPVIELGAKTGFSFSQVAHDSELADLSSTTYSQIASALYMAVLNTNFIIAERHISNSIPDSITPGFEAKVDFGKNIDLQLYNPNEGGYRIEFNWTSSELQVAIKGEPLLYDYSARISGTEKFEPRTIQQYSPLLKRGQKSVEKEGEAGLLVTVNREIYTRDGQLLEIELLSEDFYPPVNRIEILAVPPATLQAAPSANTVPDAVTPPAAELEQEPGSNPATPKPVGSDRNEPATNSTDEPNQDSVEDSDEMWGKPNESPK